MEDMGHDVFFHKGHRGIKAYAYHEGSGTKLELERVNGVSSCQSSLLRAVRALRRTAIQEHTLHFPALKQIEDMLVQVAKAERPN